MRGFKLVPIYKWLYDNIMEHYPDKKSVHQGIIELWNMREQADQAIAENKRLKEKVENLQKLNDTLINKLVKKLS